MPTTNSSTNTHHTTLHYLGGNSDKIYQAWVEADSNNQEYVVNFAFGRRGSSLQVGTKTQTPVSQDRAKVIYDKLVEAKVKKGYRIISCLENQNKVNDTQEAQKHYRAVQVGNNNGSSPENIPQLLPQLLNPIELEQLESLCQDPKWVFQEKFDGKRMLIEVQEGKARAYNRKGQLVGAPAGIIEEAETLAQGKKLTLDGEAIAEELYVFDVLSFEKNIQDLPYSERLKTLEKLGARFFGMHIKFVETHKSKEKKKNLLKSLQESKAEGLVAKNLESPYKAGRPNSGGPQLKYKFVKTASVIVEKHNEKHSVSLVLMDGKKKVSIGNVTIPQREEMPKVNSVLEVKYLYAMPNSNSLYQPVFLSKREDIEPSECCLDQLEYKN
jgi:bifunctional non-homologous end joining protein LigD